MCPPAPVTPVRRQSLTGEPATCTCALVILVAWKRLGLPRGVKRTPSAMLATRDSPVRRESRPTAMRTGVVTPSRSESHSTNAAEMCFTASLVRLMSSPSTPSIATPLAEDIIVTIARGARGLRRTLCTDAKDGNQSCGLLLAVTRRASPA
eukprot:scaffold638_cov382-Prasinococcus_capsulatus_cf.AAC.7